MLDYFAIFTMALLMSFSHCVGMCGGIVVAYSMKLNQMSFYKKIYMHLFYNFGRLSMYVLIGLVCGILGQKISVSRQVSGYFLILLGALMMLFAVFFVFYPKVLAKLEPNISQNQFFKKLFSYFLHYGGGVGIYFLGILNGLLPCGMIYYFASLALSAGGVLDGMGVMVVFGIATMLPLMILGIFVGFGISSICKKFFLCLSFIFMMGFGMMNIYKGVQKLNTQNHQEHHMHHH
ncbi:sulfite exporter TauE/SafE family protein [Helicobacter anatolicus]|uniref:sulfite exporter TauE/SafE family protein n=1 Tax=Helicobacter anatolicus TaxID=2905874 RepID=UPI001E43AAF9|nr:sulfite exporter TauE/SafE family protein [Helicobacter anatolicus]MCE3037964.1 sulfite exporter TauE/SafE family protein [Helicobacter anatolicus]